MNKKELARLLKYSDPKELYVVTWDNKLKVLKCPFDVKVIYEASNLATGQILQVQQVKITKDLKTVFIIGDQAYHYHYFDIII